MNKIKMCVGCGIETEEVYDHKRGMYHHKLCSSLYKNAARSKYFMEAREREWNKAKKVRQRSGIS